MSVAGFLEELRQRHIEIGASGGMLKCSAPAGAIDPELRQRLQQHKAEILDFLVTAQQLASQPPAIVPLQPAGGLAPIFAVAGHNGDVFCFRALAQQLGKEQPFFGLQPPGLDEGSQPLASVEALAGYFAEQILRFRPDTPYLIAGYCAGGTIAFELARQLQRRGATIRLLVLFGSPYPAWYRFLPQAWHLVGEQLARLARHLRILVALPAGALQPYLRSKLRQRRLREAAEPPISDGVLLAAQTRVKKATLRAVRAYQPQYFPGRLCQILPNRTWQQASATPLLWPTPLATEMEVYCGPDDGAGDRMLLAPHVSPFAELFRACRDRA